MNRAAIGLYVTLMLTSALMSACRGAVLRWRAAPMDCRSAQGVPISCRMEIENEK